MPEVATLAAVGWGISVLGWLISPVVSKLVNKGLDYLNVPAGSSAIDLHNRLVKNFGLLKSMLEKAQAVPPGAEKAELEGWVKDLKSAFYDAQDILDEIDYHRLKWEATFHRLAEDDEKEYSNLLRGSKDRLNVTLTNIQNLIDDGQKLPLLTTSGGNIKSSPEQTMSSASGSGSGSLSKTTSEAPKVFGRAEDTKEILNLLHDKADHAVVGIYGIPGSGKTTLAQHVCECEKNCGVPYFELIMWIHVTKEFSVHTVYKEMLEIASGKKMDELSNLDMLQNHLKKSLKGKRLLLVLDDVWYSESVDQKNDLEKLLSPLKVADKVSRVLMTSRTEDAAKFLGAQNPMQISDMYEKQFFEMFMHYALHNTGVSEEEKGRFNTVGREISMLLPKSPLAATTLAGYLRLRTSRAEDIDLWVHIKRDLQNNDTKRKQDLLERTMEVLWWSYHQLGEHVRQCFAYCSMFPRRHKFTRDELVQMWMAQGFVVTSENSDMESVAREYFKVLVSASFIQPKPKTSEQEYYTVHDLLHDLAESVAGSECFRIEKGTVDQQIPQHVRHLFIDSGNVGDLMEQFKKVGSLRTLVMSYSAKKITAKEFESMLQVLKKLRFVHVYLEKSEAKNVIPECIGGLKHLRFLGLGGFLPNAGIDLPHSFTQLYHLQELFVPCGKHVNCVNSEYMADLTNLRRIECFSVSIPHIGRMRWLQALSAFTVKKEKGYEITQLEKLDNLHGKLSIKGLGNIQSKEDARQANLRNKEHLSRLVLDFEIYDNNEQTNKKQKTAAGHHQQVVTHPKPEEILEALHPPALLVDLFIESYDGSTFPSWLSGADGNLEHLEILSFYNCHGPGSSQFKFSKPFFPRLHKLDINTCNWDALPDGIEQMASLKELTIRRCKYIKSLPGLPPSLKKFKITVCKNIKKLPKLPPSLEVLECDEKSLVKKDIDGRIQVYILRGDK